MKRVLGHFTTASDAKTAASNAKLTAWVVFALAAAASLRLSRFLLLPVGALVALVVFALFRRIALSGARRGELDVVDDEEQGPLLVLRRDGPGVRVPLREAKLVGRTRTLATVGPVRFQIEVRIGDQTAFACNLAIPFRAAPSDVEGVVVAQYDVDRDGSRALDALSYEIDPHAG